MNWLISINGIVIDNANELREQIAPILSDPGNLEELVELITEARTHVNPSSLLEPWIDKEPAFTGLVEFLSPPSNRAIDGVSSQTSLAVALETTAVSAFIAGLDDHFLLTEDRGIMINHENPPSLDQAYQAIGRLMDTRNNITKLENFTTWTLGALIDQCELFYGSDFDMSQAMDATSKTYNTCITSLNVFRAFRTQRFNLSFTHHKEVLYSNITDEDKMAILRTAERLEMSTGEMRKLTSFVRRHGIPEGLDTYMVKEELLERVKIRNTSTNFLFRFANRWFRHFGSYEALPIGADPIFNADTGEQIIGNTVSPVEHWQMTGTEAPAPQDQPVEVPVEVVADQAFANDPYAPDDEVSPIESAVSSEIDVIAEEGIDPDFEEFPDETGDDRAGRTDDPL